MALLLPLAASAARKERRARTESDLTTLSRASVDPAFVAMLGSAVPAETAIDLASRLRVPAPEGGDAPLASRLAASADGRRFEASGLSLTLRTINSGDFRIEDARVSLAPSADGSSCRFELSGVPFGAGSRVEASGTVTWGSGPLQGHGLEAVLHLDGAPVDVLRTAFPKRFDPSVGGTATLDLKASGIVGETTTEDAPATPLRGHFDAGAEWTVLGRGGPLAVSGDFALDDRNLRVMAGHVKWQDFDLGLQGWFDPSPFGNFDFTATFAGIDSRKTAAAWNVPPEWTPSSTLSGRFTWKGKAGDSILRYEATAPSIDLPAYGGWPVHVDNAKLAGGILEVNFDASASVQPGALRVGDLVLPPVPGGLQWWRNAFTFATSKTPVWGGQGTLSIGYKPAEHPAFSISGALVRVKADEAAAVLLAPLGLDVDGKASMAWSFGQDGARVPKWTVHGSLTSGRLGNVDFFAKVLDALAAAEPSLALRDAASLVPRPRAGAGTRVDRLFLEVAKKDGGFELGGILLGSGEFGFEGDGRWSLQDGLAVEGVATLPPAVAARLAEAAPWVAALRSEGGAMMVPVTVRGTTAAPVVALDALHAALVAKARRGEPAAPPAPRTVRHVGIDGLASIPGDPNAQYEE